MTDTTYGARSEREQAAFWIWRRVNEIACSTEDLGEIRGLIAEAGIAPNTHVGTDPSTFTPLMVCEWVLGQWADMLDGGSPFINSARNISLHQHQRVTGEPDPPWLVGDASLYMTEVSAIAERMTTRGDQ